MVNIENIYTMDKEQFVQEMYDIATDRENLNSIKRIFLLPQLKSKIDINTLEACLFSSALNGNTDINNTILNYIKKNSIQFTPEQLQPTVNAMLQRQDLKILDELDKHFAYFEKILTEESSFMKTKQNHTEIPEDIKSDAKAQSYLKRYRKNTIKYAFYDNNCFNYILNKSSKINNNILENCFADAYKEKKLNIISILLTHPNTQHVINFEKIKDYVYKKNHLLDKEFEKFQNELKIMVEKVISKDRLDIQLQDKISYKKMKI